MILKATPIIEKDTGRKHQMSKVNISRGCDYKHFVFQIIHMVFITLLEA